jgi:phenylalanyl-tRNA synthetase alpha chain
LQPEQSDVGSALVNFPKAGGRMNAEHKAMALGSDMLPEVKIAAQLLTQGLAGPVDEVSLSDEQKAVIHSISKKRGASASPFKVVEKEDVVYALTETGEQPRTLERPLSP